MTSRRSTAPRAICSKCDSTPNAAAMALRLAGRPTSNGSSPTRISRNITATPRMNAVIWLRVTLEAQTPTAANPATRNAAPMYCATSTPTSRRAPIHRPRGMASVSARAIHRNATCPRYLPSSSSRSVIGCASTDVFRERPHRDRGDEEQQQPRQQVEHRAQRRQTVHLRLPEIKKVVYADENHEQDV